MSVTHSRLAVILHADVVGSTRLVQLDERTAHRRIQEVFSQFSNDIVEYGGTTQELRGDALVAEFQRPSDAVCAALTFQAANANQRSERDNEIHPCLRIGIALGEVVVANKTITGAGVILAQRLEQVADPGSVVIQGAVYEILPRRLPFEYLSLGELRLKGFEDPIRGYSVVLPPHDSIPSPEPNVAQVPAREDLAVEQPPPMSIAVMPFSNLSNDPDQESFADGMAEDIIIALSRFRELLVVARNSTFTFKGQAVDVPTLAEALNVRYLLQGSVRKSGDRIRVTSQLIQAQDGKSLWAERFDRVVEDIFLVQDEITERIVSAIAPELQVAEQGRVARSPPGSVDAWSQYQLGLSDFSLTRSDLAQASKRFEAAISLDPGFVGAYAWLATVRYFQALSTYVDDRDVALGDALKLANQAVMLDGSDAIARVTLGRILGALGDAERAEQEGKLAISLNPNLWWVRQSMGYIYYYTMGDGIAALEEYEAAARLNPRNPNLWGTFFARGAVHRGLGQLDEAVKYGRMAIQSGAENSAYANLHLAASLALAGNMEEAQRALAVARKLEPDLSISSVRHGFSSMHRNMLDPLVDGLRVAGLPE